MAETLKYLAILKKRTNRITGCDLFLGHRHYQRRFDLPELLAFFRFFTVFQTAQVISIRHSGAVTFEWRVPFGLEHEQGQKQDKKNPRNYKHTPPEPC